MSRYFILLLFIVGLAGCQRSPEPINFGTDHCDYCRMTIADPKYGAELITEKGRVYKFDAMECMINYLDDNEVDAGILLGIAYDQPEILFPIDSLVFSISEKYRSPMGANLAAFKDATKITDPLSWEKVRKKLKVE